MVRVNAGAKPAPRTVVGAGTVGHRQRRADPQPRPHAKARREDLRPRPREMAGQARAAHAAQALSRPLADPGLRRLGRRGQGRRHPARGDVARCAPVRHRPDRGAHRGGAAHSLSSGASGARSPRAAASRSSIAPGTAACWSSASRASATSPDWMRAYDEINQFEEQLVRAGIVVCKFWLQISKEEQLKRFKARAEDGVQALQDHAGRLAQPEEMERLRAGRRRHGRPHVDASSHRGRWSRPRTSISRA